MNVGVKSTLTVSVGDVDVLHDAEVDDRDDRDLRIGNLGERIPDLVRRHHCAPAGAERRTEVISSHSSASSSSWTPRAIGSTSGSARPSFS